MTNHEPAGGTQPPASPYGAPTAPALPPQDAAAPKKKSILKRWWFWLIIVIVVIGLINAVNGGGDAEEPAGGGTAQEPSTSGDEDAHEQEPDAEEPEGTTPDQVHPGIGDTVTVGDFEITVTSIETGVASVGGDYLSEDAQGAFTLLNVEVTNIGKSGETVFSSSFTVLDADEREFDAHSTASLYLGDSGFMFEQINPGNTAKGILVFDLPVDVVPEVLEFSPGFFGSGVTIDLT